MSDPKWSKELPDEEGFFWFYGTQFPGEPKSWGLVKKVKIQNGFMTTLDGHFLFDYKCDGHFCRVEFPEAP
jgi:hypothetical protein